MGHVVVALRLAVLCTSFIGLFSLYRSTLVKENVTVFQAVYSHCLIVLISLAYYCVIKFFILSCRSREVPFRKPYSLSGGDYGQRLQRVSPIADMVAKLPRLTIQNIWILVYGLGLVFFITGYCFLCIHPVCLACAGLGLGVLCVDELVCPRNRLTVTYSGLRYSTLVIALLALVLVSADLFEKEIVQYITTLDLYSIFFGMVLPFAGQFIMIVVRDNKHHSFGTVIEVCEFGFPFATFLGIFHLSVAYGQRFQLHTDSESERQYVSNTTIDYSSWYPGNFTSGGISVSSSGQYLTYYFISPLLLVPGMISYVACILEGTAIDPMLSLTLALCIQHITLRSAGSNSLLGIVGVAVCSVAIFLRIFCEYDPPTRPRPSFQMESSQLPYNVVWGRDRRRAMEAEELTRDLEPIAPQP
jgi:hypothetical protein